MDQITNTDNQIAARFLSGAASLDDAIDQAFSELPRKVRTLLRRWAVQDEPYKHGKPIRQKTLARKCKINPRTLRRYLVMAREENPSIFEHLKRFRTERLRKTGMYTVG
jgi:hypothetical protein